MHDDYHINAIRITLLVDYIVLQSFTLDVKNETLRFIFDVFLMYVLLF